METSTNITGENASAAMQAQLLLDVRAVERITTLKKATLLKLGDQGKFPRPLILLREASGKPRKLAWRSKEVTDWLETRERMGG